VFDDHPSGPADDPFDVRLAIERVATMDPLELLGAIALSPRAWPRFARIRLAALRRRVGR